MKKKTVKDLQLAGKVVFMRVDFNVPLKDGIIGDDTRIKASLPTIQYVLEQKPKRLVLASHLGRPKGKVVPEMSLAACGVRLAELLDKTVEMMPDSVGEEVAKRLEAVPEGGIALLENVRFHAEETSKVEAEVDSLAKQFGAFADVFVNDAFGSAHRAQGSVCNVAKFVKEGAGAGFLLQKEIDYLISTIDSPERPFVSILGGAKISGKIDVISNLLGKVDSILIGGAMAYTFLKAMGLETGKSLVEDDRIEMAKETLEQAKSMGKELLLPVDHVVASACEAGQTTEVTPDQAIPADKVAVDIGPKTVELYSKKLAEAKTVVWNGPMGVFEIEGFNKGTIAVAEAVAASGATSIVGGGDSVSAVKKAGVADKMSHISTGGGASLELLGGKELPGLLALDDA